MFSSYGNRPYLVVYPEKQWLATPQQSSEGDEDGDKFWQSFFSYFSSCDSDGSGEMKKAFELRKSTNQATQMVDREQSDKIGEKPDVQTGNKIESTPQKPFYFIIPPGRFPGGPSNFPGSPITFTGGTINRPIFIKSIQPDQSKNDKIEKLNVQTDNAIGSLPQLFNQNQSDKIVEKPNVQTDNNIVSEPQKPFYFIIPPTFPSIPTNQQIFFKPLPIFPKPPLSNK